MLVTAGHEVVGATRSAEKAALIEGQGASAVRVDFYDATGVEDAVRAARPDVIVSQLTDLPQSYDEKVFDEALKRNADIRRRGTANIVRAALVAGTPRLVTQSVAFLYASGPEPHRESDPLEPAEGSRAGTVGGVVAVERLSLETPGLDGIVLRYGLFYGPGTWYEEPTGQPPVHVDAAAYAAFLALDAKPGIYNIAEDTGFASIERARRLMHWDPSFRA
jgi:nucleoside-diphosphate-sugar epimerase